MSETVKTTSAARGQKIVVSTMPLRDSRGDAGKGEHKMVGSRDDLSHSLTSGNKVPTK